jgi:hypothetical protein
VKMQPLKWPWHLAPVSVIAQFHFIPQGKQMIKERTAVVRNVAPGPSRHFAATQQSVAFGGKATLTPRSFDDDPAMGFNRRKMEDRRRKTAEKEAAARRATEKQILEDVEHLVAVWNELSGCRCCSRRRSAQPSRPAFGSNGHAVPPAALPVRSICGRSTGTAVRP